MSSPQVESAADGMQDALFDGDFGPLPDDFGFRGPVACNLAGITYRQLDYWARTDLVRPSIATAAPCSVAQRQNAVGSLAYIMS